MQPKSRSKRWVIRFRRASAKISRDAIAALKDVLKGDDKAQIESKTQALAEASGKLAERMYAQQQGEGGGQAQGKGQTAESADGDDVVDAEYEEVDDRKK